MRRSHSALWGAMAAAASLASGGAPPGWSRLGGWGGPALVYGVWEPFLSPGTFKNGSGEKNWPGWTPGGVGGQILGGFGPPLSYRRFLTRVSSDLCELLVATLPRRWQPRRALRLRGLPAAEVATL